MDIVGRAAAAAWKDRSPGPISRREKAWLAAALAGLALAPLGSRAEETHRLDLAAALVLARKNNPELEAARRRVDEARGELTGARVLLRENPELDVGVGGRRLDPGAEGNRFALDAAISQRFEIAGQRGKRVELSAAEVAAAEGDADAAARALDLGVAVAFYEALGNAERTRVSAEHEALARELLAIAEARHARGAASPLDVNAARVRLAEASRQLLAARSEERAAAVRLAALLGLDPSRGLTLTGGFPEPRSVPVETLRTAAEHRPEVRAAQGRVHAARAASDLVGRAAFPDVALGARYQVEEAVRLGRQVRRISAQNIAFSLLVLSALIPLALLGAMSVAAAVLVHEASELLAVANGLRAGGSARR